MGRCKWLGAPHVAPGPVCAEDGHQWQPARLLSLGLLEV